MSPPSSEFVVVYDISDNRERRRVDKCLKGFGQRIQKSVFECRLRKRDLSELTTALEALKIKTGFLKVYRLEYDSSTPVIGEAPPSLGNDDNCAFIL